MPSSHSACVCSVTTVIGITEGMRSSVFAVSAILSLVVMYDAINVRRSVGEQAKFLNAIFESKAVREVLGHTPAQVLAGAVIGIVTGLVTAVI